MCKISAKQALILVRTSFNLSLYYNSCIWNPLLREALNFVFNKKNPCFECLKGCYFSSFPYVYSLKNFLNDKKVVFLLPSLSVRNRWDYYYSIAVCHHSHQSLFTDFFVVKFVQRNI